MSDQKLMTKTVPSLGSAAPPDLGNRLRKENATLSAQVKELEASGGGDGFSLGGDGETPEQLKAKIQDFIATINDVLGEPVEAA